MAANIEPIKKEYENLLQQLSAPGLVFNWEKFEKFSKRKIFLEKIITKAQKIQEIKNKIKENETILRDEEDKELFPLVKDEIEQFQTQKNLLENELEGLLNPGQDLARETSQSVIIEIRAGTGGMEAALFAADLFRMYSKYASLKNWKEKILDSRPNELEGFKEIIFELKDGDIFSKMKYEAGVHRVQRIPTTEKSGRIHTSTASVAVLLKPQKAIINIKPEDLKIDFYRASGPGGQNVNKRETAVRISHLPTGLVVTSQAERNQLQNKENALAILSAKLLEKKEEEEQSKMGGTRKSQIGQAKRAEKIRTYNFPQDRITDHRIKKTFHDIEAIMDGKIEPIIKALNQLN